MKKSLSSILITLGALLMAQNATAQPKLNFVLIKGGSFLMGSPSTEPERSADEWQHKVTVGDFYMAKTEVSQLEYRTVMGTNPSETPGDNLPVTNVSWYDAVRFCNELSKKEGFEPCYEISGSTVIWNKNASGYRLPTEAEWEYAARANTSTPFSFGSYVKDKDANCYNAYGYNNDASGRWVNGYLQHTVEIQSYGENPFGLYNMHGNVCEWVWDWYGEYDLSASSAPAGKPEGNYKVIRGGGWNDMPKHIRSAYRGILSADLSLYSVGFRPVRSVRTEKSKVTSAYKNPAKSKGQKGRVLIAYFSQTGNTEGLAKIIQKKTNADIFRIERKVPYSANYNSVGLYGEALDELRKNAAPDLKNALSDKGLNIDDYDVILLGFCNWWASIPAPVSSFLKQYDLSGKTIIPFASMGGGRFGQCLTAISKLTPNSVMKSGLDVTYSSYDEKRIEAWLSENGIK